MGNLTNYDCLDCRSCTDEMQEYYAVHDDIWEQVTDPDERLGMLCIGCLEKRLGREITSQDFKLYAPVNLGLFPRSDRMCDRLHK